MGAMHPGAAKLLHHPSSGGIASLCERLQGMLVPLAAAEDRMRGSI